MSSVWVTKMSWDGKTFAETLQGHRTCIVSHLPAHPEAVSTSGECRVDGDEEERPVVCFQICRLQEDRVAGTQCNVFLGR